jgi:hypothetical protein
MGSVIEPGQLVDHHEMAVLEPLVVQEPAAVSEDDRTVVLPGDHREGDANRIRPVGTRPRRPGFGPWGADGGPPGLVRGARCGLLPVCCRKRTSSASILSDATRQQESRRPSDLRLCVWSPSAESNRRPHPYHRCSGGS